MHYGYAKINWKKVREVAGRVYDRVKPFIGEVFPRAQPAISFIDSIRPADRITRYSATRPFKIDLTRYGIEPNPGPRRSKVVT